LLTRAATALWGFWATHGYVTEGVRVLEEALEHATAPPARALLGRCALHMLSGTSENIVADAEEALRACEGLGDEYSLAQAWTLLGRVRGSFLGSMGRGEEAWRRALEYAERGDYAAEKAESMRWLMISAIFGPLPAAEGISRCKHFADTAGDDRAIRAFAYVERAVLEAMVGGEFDSARRLLAEGTQTIGELGLKVWAANNAQEAYLVEQLAGTPEAAIETLQASYETLEQMGERGFLSTIAGFLAQAHYAREDYEEAERFSRASADAADDDDVLSQVLWRTARAKVLARRGEVAAAEALVREALELVEATDLLNAQGDALLDLAEVLRLAGRTREAATVAQEAATRYEQKENRVSLARAREAAANHSAAP
jgi:tetratricopeptide (TPR) repeat protein